ncbi:MAG: hypothetical protein KDD25_07910, partial [Bdellovibrionales bacterium]|nr:hypothetical protein [Bdellovibrionales bacterium]
MRLLRYGIAAIAATTLLAFVSISYVGLDDDNVGDAAFEPSFDLKLESDENEGESVGELLTVAGVIAGA